MNAVRRLNCILGGGGRTILCDLLFLFSNNKRDIVLDIMQYEKNKYFGNKPILALNYCLLYEKTFRNVFYYRIKKKKFLCGISKILLPPYKTISISGDFGGGLKINHNYCVLLVNKAGENLVVHQGVTIGKGSNRGSDKSILSPTIGNNVYIGANSVVIGNINIGNNVNIGAGTIVVKDIPDNSTVVGVAPIIIDKFRPQ